MIIKEQEMLKEHTTFRIGGPADFYLIPESAEQVQEAVAFAGEKGLPYYVIGKGSNILFGDKGFRGVVIEIGKGMAAIENKGDGIVVAGAGISMSAMAVKLAEWNLTGFEFAGGIPGTLGGGIAMNAGAYGGEIKDCIQSAVVLTREGKIITKRLEELELGYRSSSILRDEQIVLQGTFQFAAGEKEKIQNEMRELNARRRDKQPLEFPSAGSTFKRPEGYFAGKLIQDAGLAGYRVGDAMVSDKHCGFVVNCGNATAAEVKQLIEQVQKKIQTEFDVLLEPEVRLVGEF
ncbi:MAG: UDP-N-acetylmuramate dehydrogenase [Eubacterium sp.]|nr:UDP-N-acetylmuramate dehydrogenase [Eubacterium sp.]